MKHKFTQEELCCAYRQMVEERETAGIELCDIITAKYYNGWFRCWTPFSHALRGSVSRFGEIKPDFVFELGYWEINNGYPQLSDFLRIFDDHPQFQKLHERKQVKRFDFPQYQFESSVGNYILVFQDRTFQEVEVDGF